MTRFSSKPSSVRLAGVLAAVLALAVCGFAQVGSPPPPTARPTTLPLSGRGSHPGGVVATESPISSTTTSVNTVNPTVSVTGAYSGSTSSTATMTFSGKLSLADAIQRGLVYNLGAVGVKQALNQVHGSLKTAPGSLLPNITADVADTEETFNLKTIGFSFSFFRFFRSPTSSAPSTCWMCARVCRRASVTLPRSNNYRVAQQLARAGDFSVKDAQDLVVLAVAGSSVPVIAAAARVDAARTQLDTAKALYQRTVLQT